MGALHRLVRLGRSSAGRLDSWRRSLIGLVILEFGRVVDVVLALAADAVAGKEVGVGVVSELFDFDQKLKSALSRVSRRSNCSKTQSTFIQFSGIECLRA